MKYIRGFDGLRAISIIFVIAGHVWLPESLPDRSFLKENYSLISGLTGVMIFFTLSGFLITSLLLEEKKLRGRIYLKNFFIRRFLRLLPPLFFYYITMSVLMLTHALPSNFTALLFSFFYVYNFAPSVYWIGEIFHTWSLGVEEQFYLFWPFALNAAKSVNKKLLVPCTIIFISLVWLKMIPGMTISYKGNERLLTEVYFPYLWFIPACIPIMTGAIAAITLFFFNAQIQKYFSKKLLFLFIAFFIYAAPVYLPASLHDYELAIQSLGVSLILVWIYLNPRSVFVNILEFRPLRFIGLISYGIYVYQGLFLRTGPGGTLFIQKYPLNICLTIIAAVLSYYLVERNVKKFKNRFK